MGGQLAQAPAAPSSAQAESAGVTDAEIEAQLKALGI